MCKHENKSCVLLLGLFVLYIVCSTFVLSTVSTGMITAPENLVEHSYQALYYRFNQH